MGESREARERYKLFMNGEDAIPSIVGVGQGEHDFCITIRNQRQKKLLLHSTFERNRPIDKYDYYRIYQNVSMLDRIIGGTANFADNENHITIFY